MTNKCKIPLINVILFILFYSFEDTSMDKNNFHHSFAHFNVSISTQNHFAAPIQHLDYPNDTHPEQLIQNVLSYRLGDIHLPIRLAKFTDSCQNI